MFLPSGCRAGKPTMSSPRWFGGALRPTWTWSLSQQTKTRGNYWARECGCLTVARTSSSTKNLWMKSGAFAPTRLWTSSRWSVIASITFRAFLWLVPRKRKRCLKNGTTWKPCWLMPTKLLGRSSARTSKSTLTRHGLVVNWFCFATIWNWTSTSPMPSSQNQTPKSWSNFSVRLASAGSVKRCKPSSIDHFPKPR